MRDLTYYATYIGLLSLLFLPVKSKTGRRFFCNHPAANGPQPFLESVLDLDIPSTNKQRAHEHTKLRVRGTVNPPTTSYGRERTTAKTCTFTAEPLASRSLIQHMGDTHRPTPRAGSES